MKRLQEYRINHPEQVVWSPEVGWHDGGLTFPEHLGDFIWSQEHPEAS
jgi:hypothetical protein